MTTQYLGRGSGGNVIPVREFSSVEELRAHQARIRAKFFPVAPPPPRLPETVIAAVIDEQAILARDEEDPVLIEYRKQKRREQKAEQMRKARAKAREAREKERAEKAAAEPKKRAKQTAADRREYFRLWAAKRRENPDLRKFDNAIRRARLLQLKEENPEEYERRHQRRLELRRARYKTDKARAATNARVKAFYARKKAERLAAEQAALEGTI